jgi:hypothetical protein
MYFAPLLIVSSQSVGTKRPQAPSPNMLCRNLVVRQLLSSPSMPASSLHHDHISVLASHQHPNNYMCAELLEHGPRIANVCACPLPNEGLLCSIVGQDG